ncbi:MAG: hypothetical protein ABL864_05770 [Terricaulis sp.]|jgi:hypothetical protein
MNRAAIFAASLVGGLASGWVTAVRAPAPALSEQAPAWAASHHGGESIGAARERLAALGYGAAEVLASDEALQARPPPDVAILFRRDLTAIEQRADGPLAWIVDFTQPNGRRGLRPGDVYQDGWRVSIVSEQIIELRRRRETRRVAVFVPPPAEEVQESP